MPEISIIVPIYNSEKYLEKCLDSLIKQTFEDIEILAINDGSRDGCKDILCDYQERYPDKLRVFEQDNVGISRTRNRGIHEARGKYLAFIDSDDSVDSTFCEQLYNKIKQDNLDVVVCDYFEVTDENEQKIEFPHYDNCTVYEKPELLYRINTSPWNKLYRKEFLLENEIEFPVGLKYEDVVFWQQVLARKAKVGTVALPLVFYRIHSGSESTVVKKNVFDILAVLEIVCDEYERVNTQDYQKIYIYLEQFTINRITVYNLQQIYQEDEDAISLFIEKGFEFLNEKFPDWRKNQIFIHENNFIKRFIKRNISYTKMFVKCMRRIKQ